MEKLFDNVSTFALFLSFFLPGFVSLKVYDALVPSERRDFSKGFYEVIAFSTLNNVLLFPLIRWIVGNGLDLSPYLTWLAAMLVLIAFPCTWPIVWIRVLETEGRRHKVERKRAIRGWARDGYQPVLENGPSGEKLGRQPRATASSRPTPPKGRSGVPSTPPSPKM